MPISLRPGSLPAMMRAGYGHRLSTGAICASSTLAQIIPLPTVLIFVGDILQGVNQQTQIRLGNCSPDKVSVGELFAGAPIPGLILVGLYTLRIVYKAVLAPETCPPLPQREGSGSLWRDTAVALEMTAPGRESREDGGFGDLFGPGPGN